MWNAVDKRTHEVNNICKQTVLFSLNLYQVYWENGAQITSPHDKEIIKCIEECVEPWNGSWNDNLVDTSPLRQDPLKKICDCYMEDLKKICYHRYCIKIKCT